MKSALTSFLIRYERLIPFVLFVLFLGITLPGISWGAPDLWNPDELFWRVSMALGGEMKFDETEPDFNYPSLPKHVMYGVGWLVQEVGGSQVALLVSARLISVFLGALTVILIYAITKMASRNIFIRLLAAFLALSSTVLVHNARFAHNDLYLLFFITLALYALLKFRVEGHRLWLYLAFFSIGCAASSKYTGVSYLAVLVVFFLIAHWGSMRADWLRAVETLFIASLLTVAGYVIGTPKALLWMSFYFKRMIPAALRFASYGRGPDSVIGFYGQWGTFRAAVGTWVYYLFLLSFAWFAVKLILHALHKVEENEQRQKIIFTLLVSIVIFDIPFWMSYNYVPRFFLPFLPMFTVLASLFVEDAVSFAKARGNSLAVQLINLSVLLVLALSFLNVLSVVLLFVNDARTPAGAFIQTLEPNTVIEYTLYPPSFPVERFSRVRNYPIYLLKYPGETVPTNKAFPYNKGEDGLYERGVDYLVVDSFTYARFSDEYICQTNPVECDFFTRLLAGKTDLILLASFEYSLPSYLPQVSLAAVNPVIKVYKVPR
jgi:4-amino-4-deoxy-L-arabinose transferase-like glycosyltransferase